eukprot:5739347-Prymnesium_polylepis.2
MEVAEVRSNGEVRAAREVGVRDQRLGLPGVQAAALLEECRADHGRHAADDEEQRADDERRRDPEGDGRQEPVLVGPVLDRREGFAPLARERSGWRTDGASSGRLLVGRRRAAQ